MKKSIETRREKAAVRKADYDKLTAIDKIARLDVKLGKNIGAKKQRERLLKESEVPKKVKKEVKEETKGAKEDSHSKKSYKKYPKHTRNDK